MLPKRDMSRPDSGRQPLSAEPSAPLTKRMRAVHWITIDWIVAALLTVPSLAVLMVPHGSARPGVPVLLTAAAATFFAVALRRLAPVIAFGVLVCLAVITANAGSAAPTLLFLAAAYVLYMLTVMTGRRTGVAALVLGLAVILLIAIAGRRLQVSGGAGTLVPPAFGMIIAWMTGYSVRQRRLYAQRLQEHAASSAVAEERLRIARELHDVVAHSMAVIAVQAGYGQYVIEASPAGARDALGAIQATSRDALEEMRQMLGVLRQQNAEPNLAHAAAAPAASAVGGHGGPGAPAPPAPLAPAPGLADLGRLVARTRGAGLRVSLEVSGCPRPVQPGLDLAAYRIIQEALTNVVKHAGNGASCSVRVSYTDAELVIGVTDDGGRQAASAASVPATGTGHGIIGMRERAHLSGGTLRAGPLAGGGFGVAAMLPLPLRPADAAVAVAHGGQL